MSEYKGSIELISGLKPKNNGTFPLMDAKDVAFYEDGKEIRLTDKIQQVGVSEQDKKDIVAAAVSETLTQEAITGLTSNMTTTMEDVSDLEKSVETIETTLSKMTGDNDELRLAYATEGSVLYLYHTVKNEDGTTNEDLDTSENGNVIAQTVVTGGGGGGNAASYDLVLEVVGKDTFSILKGTSASIQYNAKLTQIDAPDNLLKENITLSLYVDDVLKSTSIEKAGPGSIDVSSYLSVGKTNTIKLTASYTEVIQTDSGETITIPIRKTKRWYIQVVDMYIKSTFEDATKVYTAPISYNYTPMGNIEKTIYFILDGKTMETVTTSLSNKAMSVTIPAQTHGTHSFEVYCTGTVEGETIESEHLYYDFMYSVEGNSTPLIRAVPKTWEAQQYTTIPIKFTVFDESNETPTVSLVEDGEVLSTMTVDRTEQTWNYRPSTFGEKVVYIQCGEGKSRDIKLQITEFPYEIDPVTDGLELDFNPTGRTNQDSDYDQFYNNAKDALGNELPVSWTLSDNFDWVNGGWKTDDNGDAYFCVKAGTSVDINYLLFNDNNTVAKTSTAADNSIIYSKGNGKEFKIIFKTTNTAQSQGTWLSCAAPAANQTPVGLQMDIHNGYVHSSVETLEIPYSEDDIIEFDMNIIPTSFKDNEIDYTIADVPMVMTYEDGTPVQPKIITSAATSFKQSSAVPITIGCPYCDVHIYRIKAYNRYLADEEVLNNFIADARSAEEMVDRYLRNQIYDKDTGLLTPESVAEACPDLRILKLEVPRFTNDKKDKVDIISAQMIYKNGTRPEDNWTAVGGIHNGQGTSSNKYGYSARNIDVNLKKATITLNDGTVVSKLALNEDSVPTNYFNLKVNVASSENANNALLQKRFNRYLPYKSLAQQKDPRVKNSMEFVNCVLFIKEANEDINTHEEFSDTSWHFYAIGNIGDSKKTDSSRANDKDDTNEFVVEIVDWNRDLSEFPKDTMMNAAKYIKEKEQETDPTEYIFLKDENLGAEGILFEKTADGYVHSLDETIDMSKTYYIDILEHDDYGGDFTYEWRYITEYDTDLEKVTPEEAAENQAKNEVVQAAAKTAWNQFYRFLTQDIDEKDNAAVNAWKKEFEEYFILDSALYYYLFTLRYTMVDNRAKNSFWHYGKCADGKYRFDFWDYDNDTALGIDNAGKLEMSYGVEDQDRDAMGAPLFRGANSTFFTRLAKFYSKELEEMYRTLESNDNTVFSSTSLINEWDTWQNQFPEKLWLLDYNRKCKRTYVCGSGEEWDNALPQLNAQGQPAPEQQYLAEMMNGRKKYQRRQFERNQDIYMSSKFFGSLNRGDVFNLRGQGSVSGLAVQPDYTISITPYSNMYINLENATDSRYYHNRCYAGQTYSIPYPTDVMDFIYAYGASQIQSLGDLSKMYLQTATLASGSRLKEVILGNGTEGYTNSAFTTLQLDKANKLLEDLDIRNLSSLKGSLPVNNIPSLKRVYAQGTGITSVQFANNGLIEEAYLPATVNDLQLNNLHYLKTLSLEGYNSLSTLLINNCSGVDALAIVNASPNLTGIRITNINWTLPNASLLNRLLACGDYADQEKQSVLTGRVELGSIRQSEITAFNNAWPNLELAYEKVIPQYTVNFWREKNSSDEQPIFSKLFDELYTLTEGDDPSQELISKGLLQKESTAQYHYEFAGWSPAFAGVPVNKNLDFYGTFNTVDRYYDVSWYSDKNGFIIVDAEGNQATVNVKYGESAVYNQEQFGIPSKNTAAADNEYHLFKEWDINTGYITGPTKVYPVWETSTANIPEDTSSKDLTVAQINALSNLSLNNGLGKYIADGAQITMQLGYMPDYDGIPLIEEPVEFDGTGKNVVDTGYKLFDEDKSFVLAIDFTTGYSTTNTANTLMSCGGTRNRGMRLYSNYANGKYVQPVVQWNEDQSIATSKKAPTKSKQYRDICVIRHIKGDPNLYVYTNDRYSIDPVKMTTLNGTALASINHTLCFGAQNSAAGSKSDYGTGTIHYAKLWLNDLGDVECKKICSWVKEDITFRRCGTEMYYLENYNPDLEPKAAMSFVADQLLDGTVAFDASETGDPNSGSLFDGGWDVSDIRKWMNEKVFAGISFPWQQIIRPVEIKSLYGASGKNGPYTEDNGIVTTIDKLYLPAYAEVSSAQSADSTYNRELSTGRIYSTFTDKTSLIKTYPDDKPGFWWTRTPLKGNNPSKQVVACPDGSIGKTMAEDKDENGNSVWRYFYKNDTADSSWSPAPTGVLLAFSIGEV